LKYDDYSCGSAPRSRCRLRLDPRSKRLGHGTRSDLDVTRWLATFWLCLALTGCELIADFDRSEIPGPEGAAGETSPPVNDAGAPDGAAEDDAGE
jgi:hypothetical protein